MPIIRFENVSKSYDSVPALVDVNYTFAEKAVTAVVGRSGSGKSTLLQMINALLRPDAGRVYVYGEPIDYSDPVPLRRRIGYVVQGIGLFPHLTVQQNIRLPARLAGREAAETERQVRELMSLVGLPEEFADRYPHELSGGQQQRVGLCRAMMLEPEIFLLDEPFAALDPITRSEIHDEFLRLQRMSPRTMVLVTHDMREAYKLADVWVILENGRIVQAGPKEEVLAHPADEFIESLIHSQLEL